MAWAMFKDGKQIGKTFETKIQSQTEANEQGWILLSKGDMWLREGYEFKEFKETSSPRVGQSAFSLQDGEGVISRVFQDGYVIITENDSASKAIASGDYCSTYTTEMEWNESENRWEYGDLEKK